MIRLITICSAIVLTLWLNSNVNAQQQLERRLARALEKYPEADANGNGILTLDEAKAYRKKMRSNGGKNRARAANEIDDGKSYPQPEKFNDGARCLFLGHSFFIPVARAFDAIAQENGLENHHANFVMSGGAGGAPGRIWNSKKHRSEAEKIIATGNVHLLGMTYYDETNCKPEDYGNWIELAAKHNPDVRIFIGLCWPDAPEAKIEEFERFVQGSNNRLFKTVETLRKTFPQTEITFLNYGIVAKELKALHASGNLPEITSLISRSPQSLFRDQKGHAGPMLVNIAALSWLEHNYGIDASQLKAAPDLSNKATNILTTVREFNSAFE